MFILYKKPTPIIRLRNRIWRNSCQKKTKNLNINPMPKRNQQTKIPKIQEGDF